MKKSRINDHKTANNFKIKSKTTKLPTYPNKLNIQRCVDVS